MDILDVSDVEDGVRLVETAMGAVLPAGSTPPDYIRFLPPDWASNPALVRDVGVRRAVLERLGARLLVERLRLQWERGRPGCRSPRVGCSSVPWPTARSWSA